MSQMLWVLGNLKITQAEFLISKKKKKKFKSTVNPNNQNIKEYKQCQLQHKYKTKNMATDDSKTQSSNTNKNNKEDALSSFELCDKIYNQLESIVKGKTKMDYKNETQVSNTFESLYWQMGLLKGKISEESKAAQSQLQLNSVPSAQTQLIRSETKNLPRELMKEGFVEKRGEGPLKGWKKRYLQLYTNKTIDYYVDSTLKELKGTIYLSKSNIKDTKFENALEINYNINFGFNIHTVKRVWEFRVHSTTDRAKWIDAINDCIEQKGLRYGKGGRRQTETASGSSGNNNRLNSPQSKINLANTRGQSNSLSFLGGGNNEYLQSVENQLQKAQTTRVEHVNLDNHKTKDLALPKRKFLDLDHNFSGSDDDLLNTDSGNNSGNNSDNNNNNNGKKQISQMDSIDI